MCAFKEWLKIQETGTMVAAVSGGGGTGTDSIAQFKSRLAIGHSPVIVRGFNDDDDDDDDKKSKKKKSKKKPPKRKAVIDTIIDKT